MEPVVAPPRRLVPRGWWCDALLLIGFVAITAWVWRGGWILDFDVRVRDWCDSHRPGLLNFLAGLLNRLGQGGALTLISLGIAGYTAWRRHNIRPVLPVVAAFLVTSFTIGPLKIWTERGAPHFGGVELFSSPGQRSYPSGHAANTVVWYGILALLLTPYLSARLRRWIRFAPPAIVCVVTTYLGYHWITDTAAGLLLGLLLDRLLARINWNQVWLPSRLAGWSARS